MKRLAISVLIAGAILVPGAKAVSAIQQRPAPTATHVVRPGETLWGIARRHSKEGDVRRLVYRITELNGLSGPLSPGQKLEIPAR